MHLKNDPPNRSVCMPLPLWASFVLPVPAMMQWCYFVGTEDEYNTGSRVQAVCGFSPTSYARKLECSLNLHGLFQGSLFSKERKA